jgi:hypothetical protein
VTSVGLNPWTEEIEYASPRLRWLGFVYVAERGEEPLLAALQAVEGFLLLVALAAGRAAPAEETP